VPSQRPVQPLTERKAAPELSLNRELDRNSEIETADYADFADPERIAPSFPPPTLLSQSKWCHWQTVSPFTRNHPWNPCNLRFTSLLRFLGLKPRRELTPRAGRDSVPWAIFDAPPACRQAGASSPAACGMA
jgi:hypothetical protein